MIEFDEQTKGRKKLNMSRPQLPRPVVMPYRPGQFAADSTVQDKKAYLDDVRGLPSFIDDGSQATLDPDNASRPKISDETVTIVSARFMTQNWKRKDGTYPDDSVPECQLRLYFRRDDDDEAGDGPAEQSYKYGPASVFAPSKDGMHVRVRPKYIKDGVRLPVPRKTASAILFLQSLKNATMGKDIISRIDGTEGLKALEGLVVHVRMQKVPGMHEKANPQLLVDYVEGQQPVQSTQENRPMQSGSAAHETPSNVQTVPAVETPAKRLRNTSTAAAAVPVQAQAGQASNINYVAQEALMDVLRAEGGVVSRSQVAAAIIRIEKWKTHELRPFLLKAIKEDSFIDNASAPWTYDAASNDIIQK